MGLTDELHKNALNNAALFRPAFDGPMLSAAAYTPASVHKLSRTSMPMRSLSVGSSSQSGLGEANQSERAAERI